MSKSSLPAYDEHAFDDVAVTCSNCSWQGRGADTNRIDFYGLAAVQEAHCPNCDATVAQVRPAGNRSGDSGDETGFQIG